MAFLTHVATAVPRHAIAQAAAARAVARSLGLTEGRAESLRTLFENARVARRHSALPLERFGETLPLSRATELYRCQALELALDAAKRCLERAGLEPRSVDLVITSSCTGMLLPSLGALLVEPLGLRRDVKRSSLNEAGCAGGASALARAHEFVLAFPAARVLVVAVELPTLTFQDDDASTANLVASAIFGDGAAAALVQGAAACGVEIVSTRTAIVPGSLADMGFDLRDRGLHVVLSREVPRLIAGHTPALVRDLVSERGVSRAELGFFVLHAGGSKVLEALETALELRRDDVQVSWDVLRDFGNQSSASVLFVLEETLRRGVPKGHGVLAAFGPGVTVELALLRGCPS
jgi:alkylresorcinol/alkylpyrone synthase